MDKQPRSRAPLFIAIVLLLLPVLYVGSYLALVAPPGRYLPGRTLPPSAEHPHGAIEYPFTQYRIGCDLPAALFYPLEQIDRMARPKAWKIVPVDGMPPMPGLP